MGDKRRQQCGKCGHDRASHYKSLKEEAMGGNPDGFTTCLASFCECKKYEQKEDK